MLNVRCESVPLVRTATINLAHPEVPLDPRLRVARDVKLFRRGVRRQRSRRFAPCSFLAVCAETAPPERRPNPHVRDLGRAPRAEVHPRLAKLVLRCECTLRLAGSPECVRRRKRSPQVQKTCLRCADECEMLPRQIDEPRMSRRRQNVGEDDALSQILLDCPELERSVISFDANTSSHVISS